MCPSWECVLAGISQAFPSIDGDFLFRTPFEANTAKKLCCPRAYSGICSGSKSRLTFPDLLTWSRAYRAVCDLASSLASNCLD